MLTRSGSIPRPAATSARPTPASAAKRQATDMVVRIGRLAWSPPLAKGGSGGVVFAASSPPPAPPPQGGEGALSRRGAFTRVELGVVLILALLVLGLFLVYLPKARVNSQLVHCVNNLRRLGEGIHYFDGTKKGGAAEGKHGFLPAARIADGYAKWPVQIAALLVDSRPIQEW